MLLFVTLLVAVASVGDAQPGPGMCSQALYLNSIGYRYHPSDCGQYIQCHNRPSGGAVVVFRTCPYGYYWSQTDYNCRPVFDGCALEKCFSPSLFKMEGNCRGYWECVGNVSVARCCQAGQRFSPESRRCRNDFSCQEPCPGSCGKNTVCKALPFWNNPTRYYHNVFLGAGERRLQRRCPGNTRFDPLECGCVRIPIGCSASQSVAMNDSFSVTVARQEWMDTNALIFNGYAEFPTSGAPDFTARFSQNEATFARPLVVRFRYREIISQGTLLSSLDCKRCNSLTVVLQGTALTVTLSRLGHTQATVLLSTEGYNLLDWKEVTIVYNGRELLGIIKSGDLFYINRVQAPKLAIMDCGMRFGNSQQGNNRFYGYLESLYVYRCRPQDLY